jgi:hypothetical protein
MTATIVRLKVTLNDVEPKVLRRIEVPADIKLDRLHLILQAALGWTNSHLYEIRAKDVGFGIPDPAWPGGPLDARKATLVDILENRGTKTLRLSLRLRRRLGAYDQDRKPDGPRTERRLSPIDRGRRPLPPGGRRRPLGLGAD